MKKTSPVSRSGRFSSGPGRDVAKFTESISFDRRLWRHDLVGSIAHATMLGGIGVLTKAEAKRVVRALEAIGDDIESGRFEWDESLEDVHMNLEAELTRREPAGAKLHTGRSRNDQVLARRTTVSSSPATHTCNARSLFTSRTICWHTSR